MRRYAQIFVAVALIGWGGDCLLSRPAVADPVAGTAAPSPPVGGLNRTALQFDRAALQKELSLPLASLQEQPTEALRDHVRRLGDLHFALELAVDVSPDERRDLSEQILARVGQVGLLIRQRLAEPQTVAKIRGVPTPAPGPPPKADLAGVLLDHSGLLVRLLGGLLVAFALGYLAREHLATRATGAVSRAQRRKVSPLPVPVSSQMPSDGRPMTLDEIRKALASGHTVLLQMGYEITAGCRRRFLGLAREAQEILQGIEGQTYTVWEDPSHPNRFYELLVCRRIEILDQLASDQGPLPKLAEEIETCRVPSGFSLHRAWLGALPDGLGSPRIAAVAEDSLAG